MTKKKLRLRKRSLVELNERAIENVAGAGTCNPTCDANTCPEHQTCQHTCGQYPTCDDSCFQTVCANTCDANCGNTNETETEDWAGCG